MPDLNVWLALSWVNHRHSSVAWEWFSVEKSRSLYFCRFSQLGLLRLLTTAAIMGDEVLTIGEAWAVYDRWSEDPGIVMRHEPADLNSRLRAATRPVSRQSSPKAVGDCYLMAVSEGLDATLVTLDRALATACRKARQPVTLLGDS